ncbi:LOL3 [Zea mays]|uniref:LOL3 n=1 Tax=Zea mays TaxID=4577 RepID=A0A1D6K4U1_MAIZE|nr:LOL3 [Zea mays]
MNMGGRSPAATTIRCKYCSASLTVCAGERAIQCAQCCGVTRIRRSLSSRLPLPALTRPASVAGFPPCGGRGKKRAVLIGITYGGARRGCGELRGPINDVKCMRQLLCQRFAFPSDGIIMLTDDQKDPFRVPTKDNIRMAMQWLVQGCSSGDSLVFHFSGLRGGGGHDPQLHQGGGMRAPGGHLRPPAHLHESHHDQRRRLQPAAAGRLRTRPQGRQLQRRAGT